LAEVVWNVVIVCVAQKTETRLMTLREPGSGIYDKRAEYLPKKNVCLAEFTQSFKYFDHVEDQLRVDLTFKPSILAVARKWLEKVRTDVAGFTARRHANAV